MQYCHCNSEALEACMCCSNYHQSRFAWSDLVWRTPGRNVPRIPKKKITKEYDDKGNLIKETIEDI